MKMESLRKGEYSSVNASSKLLQLETEKSEITVCELVLAKMPIKSTARNSKIITMVENII